MKETELSPQELFEKNSEHPFPYARIQNRFDTDPIPESMTWGVFCNRFSDADYSRGELKLEDYLALDPSDHAQKNLRLDEKDGPGWLPCIFKDGGKRVGQDVIWMTAAVLDFDDAKYSMEEIVKKLENTECFIHTTYSHHPEKPRIRVIVPFKKLTIPKILPHIFDRFDSVFGGILDPCGKKPAQFYYTPSCPFDSPFKGFRNPGEIFDPTEIPMTSRYKNKTSKSYTQDDTVIKLIDFPRPCRDGERHKVFLPILGRWIAQGKSKEEIIETSRIWNQKNIDPWDDETLVSIIDSILRSDRKKHPERYKHLPWDCLVAPYPYELRPDGVYRTFGKKKDTFIKISGPVCVTALTRNNLGDDWGRHVEWLDNDGRHRKLPIPAPEFHQHGQLIAQQLSSKGLLIYPGKEKYLYEYLCSFDPQERIRSVSQLGWVDDPSGNLIYVLPEVVLPSEVIETIVFQPEKHSPSTMTIHSKGDLESWQNEVASDAQGNSFLIFALCVSFAGPLMRFASLESGGFHIYGHTSRGKTTAAQMAGSVWGCGSDPAESQKHSYVMKWNTTANGMEGLAAAHNDGLLILDEAGASAFRDFGKGLYNLTGGRGKQALTKDRGLRPPRTWAILIFSTGEKSIKQIIQEDGRIAKEGQLVRLLDVFISNSVVQESHHLKESDFIDRIKRNCGRYYGTAGPAFLDSFINRTGNFQLAQKIVKQKLNLAHDHLQIEGVRPEIKRGIKRYLLVCAAGLLASQFGILPISDLEIIEGIRKIRDAWLENHENISDCSLGPIRVREFILNNPNRFCDIHTSDHPSHFRNLVGYFDSKMSTYLFSATGFEEACRGHDPKEVLRELRRLDMLKINENSRGTYRQMISKLGKRPRFYAVKGDILEYEGDRK